MFNELQKAQLRTANLDEPKNRSLALCGLGIPGEAGEVADLIKKFFYHGRPFDREKLIEELGDVTWYISFLAHALGVDLDYFMLEPAKGVISVSGLSLDKKFTRLGIHLSNSAGIIAEFLDDLVFGHPHAITELDLKAEVACLIHYLTELAFNSGCSYTDLIQSNIAKLEKRYPNGFSTADSLARKDEALTA